MKLSRKNHFISLTLLFLLFTWFGSTAASLPPVFIENKGQILDQNYVVNTEVLYMHTGNGIKIQLRKTGYSYEFINVKNAPLNNASRNPELLKNVITETHRVDIDFVNSNPAFEIIKENKQETVLNYFVAGKEVSNVNSFSKLTYKNIYYNTDIEFILDRNGSFKYNIILHPGADINAVKFLCNGASSIQFSNDGGLNFKTSLGEIKEEIPFSYYSSSPERNVPVKFKLRGKVISFSGDYNSKETLVIDPSTNRIWGTYFGGSSIEYCTANGTDASNNVYIAGYSLSASNIATSGVYQSTLTGSFDAYLSKFNSGGVQLWGTYFGGSNFDVFYAIHVMPNGIVFATGDTGSNSNVASGGAHQTVYGGGIDDAILVKFDAAGQRLWSTYMGGTLHDIAQGITVDSNGDVLITGHTESTGSISTVGTYATVYSLNYDVFVTKFNTNGVRQWGTYFGDTGADEAYAITTDGTNNIYVTGFTMSAFGISAGTSFQNTIGGAQDAFIAKLDGAGTNVIWGTYYGGVGDDKGTAIKCDVSTGNIYIGGNTTSSVNIASAGAYQSAIASADDAFMTAFTSTGNRLWGTYYGGNDVDYINSLVLDANKNILVGGQTLSTNAMSSANAYQSTIGSPSFYDGFFARFGSNGQRKQATYYGGPDNESGTGVCIDNAGKIYLSGETSSTVSISTPGSHMPNYAGSSDAFLAKFCIAPEPTVSPMGTTTTCINNTYTFTASAGYASYLWNTGSSANPLAVTAGSLAGTFYYAITVTDSDGCNGTSDSSTVIVNLCTGITEIDLSTDINIFPNPSEAFINIHLQNKPTGENVIIEMYSVLGEKVLITEANEKDNLIDVQKLAPGIYFLGCKYDSKNYIKKIIIE